MLKNDTLKNDTSHIGLYGSTPTRAKTAIIPKITTKFTYHRFLDFMMFLLVISHRLLKAIFSVKSLFRWIYPKRDRLSKTSRQ